MLLIVIKKMIIIHDDNDDDNYDDDYDDYDDNGNDDENENKTITQKFYE